MTDFNVATLAQLNTALVISASNGVADTITFTANISAGAPGSFTNGYLAYVNLTETHALTIVGGGFTLDANSYARGLYVSAGDNVTIQNLVIREGAVAGNGGAGGTAVAGGSSLGGGIVNNGTLTLQDVTVTANVATGGGGGGGLAANYVGGGGGGGGGANGVGGGRGGDSGGGFYSGNAGGAGQGGRGGGTPANMGGQGGSTTGGAGGVGMYGYSSGGAGGSANNGGGGVVGGGGGGTGWDGNGGMGGTAAGGIYNTGTMNIIGTSIISNNLGAGGGGGGGGGAGNHAGIGGLGVGAIWNQGGTLNITASNFSALAGNVGASGFIGAVVNGGSNTGFVSPTSLNNIYNNGGTLNANYVPNTAPAVNANAGLTLAEGATDAVTATLLDFNDGEQADSAITYTVTTAATNGTLFRDGVALALNSTFTQADVNDGLITFGHNGGETTSASFGFSVSDGTATVTGQTFNFTVTPVNDIPTATPLPADVTVTEDVASGLDLSAVTIADVDTTGEITVTLTASVGVLTGTDIGDVTVSGSGTGALTLTGTAADIDAFLNTASNIQYTGAPNASGNDAATVTITADDGSGEVTLGVVNVDITGVIDVLGLSGFTPSITLVENTVNATPQLLDADVTFVAGEADFDGGTLTLSGLLAEDRVAVRNEGSDAGEIGVSGSDVTWGGVVIGTLTGGSGATLTITFNGAANATAIDALIQNLTYANVSDTPTATRDLVLNVTDSVGEDLIAAPGAPVFDWIAPGQPGNPFNGLTTNEHATPTLVDLDGDGDLDLVSGSNRFGLFVWENNDGVFTAQTGADYPLPAQFSSFVFSGNYTSPAFVDLDGDGDLDLAVGVLNGGIFAFENDNGTFTALTGGDNPFDAIGLDNNFKRITFADIDGDDDPDLVVANGIGEVQLFENDAGVFTMAIGGDNPFASINLGSVGGPAFADLDGDGDLDLVLGEQYGAIRVFENTGGVFTELVGAANPFDGVDVGWNANPTFGDVDGDGDIDMVVGEADGVFNLFLNTTPVPTGPTVTVTVTAQNDVPTATGIPTDVTVGEDATTLLNLSSITLADVDTTGNITLVLAVSSGSLTPFPFPSPGVTVDASRTDTISLTGTAAAINTYLTGLYSPLGQFVVYTPASNVNGDDAATLTVTANDGSGAVTLGVINLDITAVDDTGVAENDAFTATEGGAAVTGSVFSNNGSGADSDPDTTLSVATVNGVGASVDNQITLASGALLTVNADGTFSYDQNGAFADLPGAASGASNAVGTDSFTYTLTGGGGATVTININGADGVGDDLSGTIGHDSLNGGVGADVMTGGAGDDTYYVDNTGDQVIELEGEGTDDVYSSVSYALQSGSYIQGLILTGSANLNATGNSFRNTLTGNSGNNVLNGGASNDILKGADGDDSYYIDNAADVIVERLGEGNDVAFSSVSYTLGAGVALQTLSLTGALDLDLTGNSYRNTLVGNAGDNVLDGGGSNDVLIGGDGDDTYYVDDATDVIVELADEGYDRLFSTVSYTLAAGVYVQTMTLLPGGRGADTDLTGNSFRNTLVGNSGENVLTGLGGDDVLNGKAGADTMVGGAGDDTYYVDDADDVIVELTGEGSDDVFASVSYTLQTGVYVQTLTLTGSSALNATGNGYANTLNGNSGVNTLTGGGGADILDGKVGADVMIGGTGADTYYVDNAGDVIVELAGGGVDSVFSSVTHALTSYVQNLTLTGTADIHGTGNGGANIITGNSGNNTLIGGGGNDVLIGGLGVDVLTGGAGSDTFVLTSWLDSHQNQSPDLITDLSNSDFIDLSAMSLYSNNVITSYSSGVTLFFVFMDTYETLRFSALGDHTDFDNFIFGGG